MFSPAGWNSTPIRRQRPAKPPSQVAAQERRGKAALEKSQRQGGELSHQEFADMCRYLDAAGRAEPPRRRYR